MIHERFFVSAVVPLSRIWTTGGIESEGFSSGHLLPSHVRSWSQIERCPRDCQAAERYSCLGRKSASSKGRAQNPKRFVLPPHALSRERRRKSGSTQLRQGPRMPPVDLLPRSGRQPAVCWQPARQDQHLERDELARRCPMASPAAPAPAMQSSKSHRVSTVSRSLDSTYTDSPNGAVHPRRHRYSSTPERQEGNSCPVTSRKSRQSSTVRTGLRAPRAAALSSFSSGTVRPAFEST